MQREKLIEFARKVGHLLVVAFVIWFVYEAVTTLFQPKPE
jgi:hypothetical protein